MTRSRVPSNVVSLLVALWIEAAFAADPVRRVPAFELVSVAAEIPVGGRVDVDDLRLDGEAKSTLLELERFEVFAPQARIVVSGSEGVETLSPPRNVYLRGSLANAPSSLVLLTIDERGSLRGLTTDSGQVWMIEAGPSIGTDVTIPRSRRVDLVGELGEVTRNWTCETDQLEARHSPLEQLLDQPSPPSVVGVQGGSTSYVATLAIETDREFYNRFGNIWDAAGYVGDIVAYGSTIYEAEVDTAWEIEVIYLYTSGNDPWQQNSPGCGLYEFGRYWNDNRSGVNRTLTHFMSGKNNGGGVAWLGVLCRGQFNVNINGAGCSGLSPNIDNYGGGYGYSGGLSGSFSLSNPRAVWDLVVVTHEIGHNFNSPHTHSYCNIGGNAQPVDQCIPANWGQACTGVSGQLPAGCPGTGNACGTIMSYCHGLGGTVSEIALTLGLGHPYGIQPHRVPARMLSHVQSRASGSCLAPPSGSGIFDDDFETGNDHAWGLIVDP